MKKIFSVLLASLMLLSLVACDTGTPSNTDAESTTEEPTTTEAVTDAIPEDALLIHDGEKFVVDFVRAENSDSDTLDLTLALKKQIEDLVPGDAVLTIKIDYLASGESPAEREIVVGNTLRPATETVVEKLGNVCGYSITVNKSNAVIVGSIASYTRDAIEAFTDTYLKDNLMEKEGKYYILPIDTSFVDENPSFLDVAVLCAEKGLTFDYTSEYCYKLDALGSHKSAQGACVDKEGKYLYVSMQTNDISSMAKYDLATGERLQVVANTGTDHSNDMAFNTKKNQIVVVHNAPNYTRISLFNAETMEKLSSHDLTIKMNGIAYCEERGQYAAGISGTWNFSVLDESMKVVKTISGVNTGKTRQGLDCNEDYVYFVQSAATGNPGNIIMIYSWQGEFLARVELTHNTSEGETLLHVGSQLYLHCNIGNGGTLYKLTPVIPK